MREEAGERDDIIGLLIQGKHERIIIMQENKNCYQKILHDFDSFGVYK